MNKKFILGEIEKRKAKLRAKGVKKIGLFGSYLRGTQKRGSDIDFLVTFDKISLDRHYKLQVFLEGVFRRKIDLIIEKSLRPELNYVKGGAAYVKI